MTKRYGNLKGGVKDIKGHRFIKELNWDKLINMELTMLYMPKVKNEADISNFSNYPDSDTPCPH